MTPESPCHPAPTVSLDGVPVEAVSGPGAGSVAGVFVIVTSTGGAGHFGPLVPVLAAAARREAEVLVLAPSSLRAAVAEAGHTHVVAGDPDPVEEADLRARFAAAAPDEASVLMNRDMFGRLCTQAMLPALRAAVAHRRPDLLVHEAAEYAAAVVGEESGVPHAQVAISPAGAEHGSLLLAAPVLEPLRDGVVAAIERSPYLSRFPASVDPSPYPHTVRFRTAAAPVRSVRGEVPLVYVSFGSVTGGLPVAATIYRTALAALADLPVRVVLTLGRGTDPAVLGTVPPSVRVEEWLPQDEVLAEADLVVCHGGSGTTYGALAAGVPTVVVPLFADQPINARTVEALGAGLVVAPERGPVAELAQRVAGLAPKLREKVRTVLAEPAYRTAAQAVAGELAAAAPVDDVVAALLTGPATTTVE